MKSAAVERVDMSDVASLKVDGLSLDMPVRHGTIGPDVVDIRKLYAETGVFTFDPGFTSTASCESGITFIDGGLTHIYLKIF